MAQKLKFGNGTWATKEGSTLAYNDENNNYKPLPFTTTRDSIATRVNKEGLIEVVGNDVPRIDYTDSTEGVLLLENSATNLVTYSKDFTQWTNDRVTVLENQIISPNGLQNADLISENSENNIHRIYIGSISLTDNVDYTITVFAKKGSSSVIQLTPTSTSAIGSGRANFDLENGVVSIVSGGTANIENYGNGWYRCTYTFEALATATSAISVNMVNDDLNASRNVTYTGSTNNNIYLWGGQLEVGSYATSYIPTNGSTVTRQADTASGAGNSAVFNDSEGVFYVNTAALADDGTNRMISISDGSTNNRLLIKYDNISNRIEFFVFSGGVGEYSLIVTSLTATSNNKILLKYKQNDFQVWVNGFELDANTSGNTPIGLSELSFDDGTGGNDFYGKTKELGYYDTTLTDLELETLTSYRSLSELVTELNLNTL
jgi:hypothetical protein